jgi:hypothetical protein
MDEKLFFDTFFHSYYTWTRWTYLITLFLNIEK